jgi:hypothetical protein
MRTRYVILAAAVLCAWAPGCSKRRNRSGIVYGNANAAGKEAERRAAAALAGTAEEEMGGPQGMTKKGSGGGLGKWRDVGVYVDGHPVGVVAFGELPIGLKPTWVEEEHSIEFDYGYKGPRTRKSFARRYRMTDFLKALGVDVKRIKEIQVMGPKTTSVIIASGKDLRSKKGEGFMFRFGATSGGKPIPVVPDSFGNGVMPDKMGGVFVYIDKKPPTLDGEEGLVLDGKPIEGVPYYGDPMKGGVRVYVDDRLSTAIKSQALEESPAETGADGQKHWKLATVLKQNGIDLSKVVEVWAIADERRKHKWTRAELDTLTFIEGDNDQIYVGDHVKASALALHSHVLSADELPQIRPDETME